MVVLNTCSVTRAADSDSRKKVRQAARAGDAQIVVTGCWATLDPDAAAGLPGVVQVVDNDGKDDLVAKVLSLTKVQAETIRSVQAPRQRLRPRRRRLHQQRRPRLWTRR